MEVCVHLINNLMCGMNQKVCWNFFAKTLFWSYFLWGCICAGVIRDLLYDLLRMNVLSVGIGWEDYLGEWGGKYGRGEAIFLGTFLRCIGTFVEFLNLFWVFFTELILNLC